MQIPSLHENFTLRRVLAKQSGTELDIDSRPSIQAMTMVELDQLKKSNSKLEKLIRYKQSPQKSKFLDKAFSKEDFEDFWVTSDSPKKFPVPVTLEIETLVVPGSDQHTTDRSQHVSYKELHPLSELIRERGKMIAESSEASRNEIKKDKLRKRPVQGKLNLFINGESTHSTEETGEKITKIDLHNVEETTEDIE